MKSLTLKQNNTKTRLRKDNAPYARRGLRSPYRAPSTVARGPGRVWRRRSNTVSPNNWTREKIHKPRDRNTRLLRAWALAGRVGGGPRLPSSVCRDSYRAPPAFPCGPFCSFPLISPACFTGSPSIAFLPFSPSSSRRNLRVNAAAQKTIPKSLA